MAGRCYVRNGVWGWTMEAQRAVLREAGADMSREFCDELAASKAKMPARVQPEWLTERANFLRRTDARRRGETIHVASLLVLGINEADLISAIAAALERRDTVRAADSGFSIGPGAGAVEIGAAVAEWVRAKRDAQTKPGRQNGNKAAAERARARTLKKLPAARKLWPLPTERISTADIAAQVGLSVKTLYTELGRRSAAQARRRRK